MDCQTNLLCDKIFPILIVNNGRWNIIITFDELSNFTYDELNGFTYLELSLDKTQLLQSLINNFRDDIPSSVILKLQKLCKDFLDNCASNN